MLYGDPNKVHNITPETTRGAYNEQHVQNEIIDSDERYGPVFETEPGHSEKMGVSVENDGCNVAIWAGTAKFVDVCIFNPEDHNETLGRWRLASEEGKDGIFCGHVPDMPVGCIYGIRAHGDWNPANRETYNYNKLLVDPYARAIVGSFNALREDGSQNTDVNEPVDAYGNYIDEKNETDSAPCVPRCVVVDEFYDWGNEKKPNVPKSETVIYEGHVKGLTKLREDIPEHQRGTYAGIGSEQFIGHLNKLGITSLELLPAQQSASEPHVQEKGLTNYWGYNTLGFFAPNHEYSSNKEPGGQVKEFKDMVKSLHEAGIEVILDVVYNHTPESGEQGPTLMFQGLGADFYHLSRDGKHTNYSGCGNTMNTYSDVGMNLTLDSLRYWAEEMHVDGFRFDLAPILAREEGGAINMQGRFMNALKNDPVLNKLRIIAEPWDCATYEVGSFSEPWDEWNDKFRDTVRNFWQGKGDAGHLASALIGSFSADRVVNFVTAHDGFTMNDLVSYDHKHNDDNGEDGRDGSNDNHSSNFGVEGPTDNKEINEQRVRAIRNMILTLLISAGTPMISHGDEFMRTQNGNNNAYCQDNETTWMNWELSEEQEKMLDYVAKLIHFRQEHASVASPHTELDVKWLRGDGEQVSDLSRERVIGMARTALNDTLLYYANGTHHDIEVHLPNGKYASDYEMVINTATGEVLSENERKTIETDRIAIKALSSVILARRRFTSQA